MTLNPALPRRLLCASALLLALGAALPAQQIITTYAGGGPNQIPATSANLSSPLGLGQDSAGNVYIADEHGLRIFKVDTSGKLTIVAGNGLDLDRSRTDTSGEGGPATAANLEVPSCVAIDDAGNVFDSDNGFVHEILASDGTIHTVAGGGNSLGDGGPATQAQLDAECVSIDGAGNLFLIDDFNQRIREVAAGTGIITTVAGGGAGSTAATRLTLNFPSALFVDQTGDLFIADGITVKEITLSNGNVTTVAGGGGTALVNGAAATAVVLPFIGGITVDPAGNLFLAMDGLAIEVPIATGAIQILGGGGTKPPPAALGGPATAAAVGKLKGIIVQPSGTILTSDLDNHIVYAIAADGTLSAFAGNQTNSFSGDGIPAVNAHLSFGLFDNFEVPAIATDAGGNLFLADNNRVREVSATTGVITTIAGTGVAGFGGDGQPALAATFNTPSGIAIDGAGDIFIADTVNLRIREIAAVTGLVSTVAGGGTDGGENVPALQSALLGPSTLAVDPQGNLYFADGGQNFLGGPTPRVRELAKATGKITTIAGNAQPDVPNCVCVSDNVLATTTNIHPATLGVDPAGNVFFADQPDLEVREIVAKTGFIQRLSQDCSIDSNDCIEPPTGVARDNAGNFYVGTFIGRVYRINAVTNLVEHIAGIGEPAAFGFGGDGGPALAAALDFPTGMAADGAGNLYFVDINNARIRKISNLGTAPTASLSVASLDFGAQPTAQASVAKVITVSNTGLGTLHISGISISGANAADFAITSSTTCTVTTALASGASCNMPLQFTPASASSESALLTVTDDGTATTQTAALTGNGTAIGVTVAPVQLAFGNQAQARTSAASAITLTNSGTTALSLTSFAISGANHADFASAAGTTCAANASLAAKASCTVMVAFTPAALGQESASLIFTDSASPQTQSVPLAGAGIADTPSVSLAPAEVVFAAQNVATSSAPKTATLVNTGSGPLTLAIAASGDYSQTNSCGATLAASASCAIAISFTPTARGARAGVLSVADNASGSPHVVALSGIGNAPAPSAALTPATLTFAATALKATSAAQTITLTNSGSAALTVTTIAASGDFAETNNCGASVAAGANCAILVTFTPTVVGARTGTLTMTDNASGSPHTAALSGTGADLTIGPGAGSTTTSTVSAGQPATFALAFTPVSGLAGTFALTCTGAPTAAACTPNPASIALSGTAAVPVTVTVTTTARSGLLPLPKQRPMPWLPIAVLLFALLALLGLHRMPTARRPRRVLVSVGAFALLCLMSACGGGSSGPAPTPPSTPSGTPAGTYTMVITATSGTVMRSTNLTLVVN